MTDAKGIFSYLTTHTDAYQRALDPNFWWNFDYYLYQGIFLEAAKHKSYEMLESMIKGRRVDTYYYDRVRSEFITGNDYIGMSIMGSVHDRLNADKLKQALREKDEQTIDRLIKYLDAALPDVSASEILWLYSDRNGSSFEDEIQKAVANSLLRLHKYQDFDVILNYRWKVVQRLVFDRTRGRQDYEGVPLFGSIVGYADYNYYRQLGEKHPYDVSLDEDMGLIHIVMDPQIYRKIYKKRKENYLQSLHLMDKNRYYQLLEAGFALKPEEWIALSIDVDPEDQEELLGNLIDNAYYFWLRELR